MNMLFISGSFPNQKSGIGDSADRLFSEFNKKVCTKLMTSNEKKINDYINQCNYNDVIYMDSWNLKFASLRKISRILKEYNIDVVHIEYPGDAYGRGMFINFLPFYIRCTNMLKRKKVKVFLRLHEFTKARLLRRIVIIPMIMFSNKIYVPALNDWGVLRRIFGKKINKTLIGSNINVVNICKEEVDNKINLAYFGFVYHNKGIEVLLNIFNKIKQNDKENKFKFTIIGEVSDKEDNHFRKYHIRVLKMIRDLKLEDKIRITGYLSNKDVSKELKKVDIAILPFDDGLSLRRGSFLAFLEHGIPIVTTYGDEECLNLFKEVEGIYMGKSSDELINKILSWSNDKNNLLKMGRENAEISRKFSWDGIATELIKEYMK